MICIYGDGTGRVSDHHLVGAQVRSRIVEALVVVIPAHAASSPGAAEAAAAAAAEPGWGEVRQLEGGQNWVGSPVNALPAPSGQPAGTPRMPHAASRHGDAGRWGWMPGVRFGEPFTYFQALRFLARCGIGLFSHWHVRTGPVRVGCIDGEFLFLRFFFSKKFDDFRLSLRPR
uniref:Uncharacterized protein n=1 Tax=Oryza brachyantha TaxID=4533 RepID=J3LAE1_ORYBR